MAAGAVVVVVVVVMVAVGGGGRAVGIDRPGWFGIAIMFGIPDGIADCVLY